MNQLKEISEKMERSISLKLFVIGILILIMLIPMGMIKSLIREREFTSKDALNEVSASWGNEQTISGPFVTIPYKTYSKTNNEIKEAIQYAHFLPENLSVKGNIIPETRKRGIYKVVVYKSELELSGSFSSFDFEFLQVNPKDIMWENATINLGITDMRSIQDNIVVQQKNSNYQLNPGITTKDLVHSGVSSPIKIDQEKPFEFKINLNLNGSKNLFFVPLGKETQVALESTWEHPGFTGAYLPREHQISESGFTAKWKVLHLNREYPQQWTGDAFNILNSAFGTNLIIPVNHYQKALRSVKYAIMFIALTFITFFFIEIISKKRIHAIHYLLVGFALVIFYSLLIAISEHLSFNIAYFIGSSAVITLITAFGGGLFKHKKQTIVLFSVLTVLYVFLFTILQLMDYALLMGNIGLFVVLAVVMFFTKKIKWDNNTKTSETELKMTKSE